MKYTQPKSLGQDLPSQESSSGDRLDQCSVQPAAMSAMTDALGRERRDPSLEKVS